LKGSKILVVDDERGMRDMLRAGLAHLGYRTAEAAHAEAAIRLLSREAFDLVLTDLLMPGIDGLDLLVAVKKVRPDVAVVVMTGSGTVETAVEAMKRGAGDFLQKPFEMDELGMAVEKALEKKELRTVIAIHEASRAMFRTVKIDELLPVVAELAMTVLRADDVTIATPRGARHELACARGLDDAAALETRRALAERAAARAVDGEPFSASGPLGGALLAGLPGVGDIRSAVFQPLILDGRPLGVLCACRTRNEDLFNAADARHLAIFGAQIALALGNARAFEELAQAQARLLHSERVNALGQMAAGVAHELNNPLTAVMGHAELLLTGELDAQQREDAAGVLENSARCRTIIDDLLRFGRRDGEPRLLDVGAEIAAALRLARYDHAARGLDVSVRGAEGALVLGEASQLKQVFLNLVVNAAHALESAPAKKLEISVARTEKAVVVRFADAGCGIAPENLERVFEPFFTTKPRERGTGLGLALCREIVTRMGGTIAAESAGLGRGAAFVVALPIASAAPLGA